MKMSLPAIRRFALAICCVLLPPTIAAGAAESADAAVLVSGESREATEALLRLTQDAETLEINYDALMNAVQSAGGALDRERLVQACRQRDDFLVDSALYASTEDGPAPLILAQMADCIWAAPSADVRTRLAPKFVGDVERLMNAGVVPKKRGLEIAFCTLFRDDVVIPDISCDVVLEVLKRHVQGADEETRQFLSNALRIAVYVCKDKAEELLAFLRTHFPEIGFPDGLVEEIPVEWFASHVPPSPMTRPQYEGLLRISPLELADVVRERLPSERSTDLYGYAALLRLDRLKERNLPGTDEALLGLLRDRVQARHAAGYLVPGPVAEDAPESQKKLLDAILDYCGTEISRPEDKRAPLDMYSIVWHFLPGLEKRNSGKGAAQPTYGQKRIADILLDSMEVVCRPPYSEFDRKGVLDNLEKALPGFAPENLAHIEARLSQSAAKAATRSDLPAAEREALGARIRGLAEESRKLREAQVESPGQPERQP